MIVALEPTARLRAAAGVVSIALERAARYHQSILAADAGADGAQPVGNDPETFRRFMLADLKKWAEVVKRSGAKFN